MMKNILIFLFLLLGCGFMKTSAQVRFHAERDLQVSIADHQPDQVIRTAFDIFRQDFNAVFSASIKESGSAQVQIGTLGNAGEVERHISPVLLQQLNVSHEGFVIQEKNRRLYVLGKDKRGTAYGILEISRIIGVSPWEWWADATIEKKRTHIFKKGFTLFKQPSVRYRGIFLNDEDWGLTPWSARTFEPDAKPQSAIAAGITPKMQTVGPKTYARIFELLLRLRANTIWPAMHEVTVPFYFMEGNREMAERYGIYIGSAHCEPLARNSATEWDIVGEGSYNYLENKENILSYWGDRLKELGNSDNIFTIGMRGKHDGRMEGVKTTREYREALDQVIRDQTALLTEYINPDPSKISQVIIPYKEILDVYLEGLEVPDYVTLLWCDDNYGYITHFPNEKEKFRSGGNGIYYHISYWGRPHDYLWLATNHPAQLYTQMKMAYDKGAKDMWIVNVGDIKPGEYLTELFLDMAWDIDGINDSREGLRNHLQQWLAREFGAKLSLPLLNVMNEYYRLAYIRKPEFMGNTRTEEKDLAYKQVKDLPWSERYINERIAAYEQLEFQVKMLAKKIPKHKEDAWFQLIEYPVLAAAEMNKKHLYGQLARHGKSDWKKSDVAYESIVSLTARYNNLEHGKWRNMMSFKPRNLPVFEKVERRLALLPLPEDTVTLHTFNGVDFSRVHGKTPVCHGLGYGGGAIRLTKEAVVSYEIILDPTDSVDVEIAMVPNHPVDGNEIRYSVSINDAKEEIVNYKTIGRSEEWKENVLTNQSKRKFRASLMGSNRLNVKIRALDEGVILDQINIYSRR